MDAYDNGPSFGPALRADRIAVGFVYRSFVVAVGLRTPCPGIGWTIPALKRESAGAFYDGAEDHPEGGMAWASDNARAFIDRWHADADQDRYERMCLNRVAPLSDEDD